MHKNYEQNKDEKGKRKNKRYELTDYTARRGRREPCTVYWVFNKGKVICTGFLQQINTSFFYVCGLEILFGRQLHNSYRNYETNWGMATIVGCFEQTAKRKADKMCKPKYRKSEGNMYSASTQRKMPFLLAQW